MKRSVKNLLTFLIVGTVLLATTAPVLAAQFTEENHVAPYFPCAPENSEKEIIDVIRWDNIPGNDSKLLLKFLCYTFDINWTQNATICKSHDSKLCISRILHCQDVIILEDSDNFSFEDSVLIHSNAVPAEVIVGFEDGIRELPVNNLPILIIIIDTDFTDLHRCYCLDY